LKVDVNISNEQTQEEGKEDPADQRIKGNPQELHLDLISIYLNLESEVNPNLALSPQEW